MTRCSHALLGAVALCVALAPAAHADEAAAAALYLSHCAACHGATRLGASGPALLPESLSRLGRKRSEQVIAHGRPATQMPGFAGKLGSEDIAALNRFVHTAPQSAPRWEAEDIRASHSLLHPPGSLGERPRFSADPMNLFVVVEAGDHHLSVLDGDALEPLARLPTRYALHGGPKYSPDGRYVYLASRDGWVSKVDLYNLVTVAEIRVGINTRNVAVSGDGRWVLAANYLPQTLVWLDARDLRLRRTLEVRDADGTASRVSAVYQAEPRGSFVAALKDVAELWELDASDPDAAPRKLALGSVLEDFFFDPPYRHVIGADRGAARVQVVDLDSGERVAELPFAGMPHLGSGITWESEGRALMATPDLREGVVHVIDMREWRVVKRIETLGPGFFVRSHENTPYAWVDVFFGPDRDAMHVFDKRTLELVATLRPAPGKTSAHVEFDRAGRRALVSIWEMDGALVVYDGESLAELKRLPMRKPSGKYNVHNKITRSAGTSH